MTKHKADGGVNYDLGATVLYKLIEQRKWAQTVEHMKEYQEEVKIWVYRIDGKTKKTRWRMLPLHAAILFHASPEVIKGLIESYPEAVKLGDDRKMVPVRN